DEMQLTQKRGVKRLQRDLSKLVLVNSHISIEECCDRHHLLSQSSTALLTTIARRQSYHSPPESCAVTAESMILSPLLSSCCSVVCQEEGGCPKRCDLSLLFTTNNRSSQTCHQPHTLSDGATIINREPCREVKCPLSSYLCCK
ncbi:hypothetical protein HID58_029275, partial [Brassica napus]